MVKKGCRGNIENEVNEGPNWKKKFSEILVASGEPDRSHWPLTLTFF